jgi:hypothetical protein
MAPLRSEWLRTARDILMEDCGQTQGTITLTLQDSLGNRIRYTLPPEQGPITVALALSPMEAAIVRALGAGCMIGKRLASAAGYAYNSQFRTIVSNLCERRPPVLQKTEQGYQVATATADKAR